MIDMPSSGKIWFTSDWHLGHKKILEYCNRPFDNIHDHDKAILQAVRDTVGPNDRLYVLGDISFGSLRKYRDEISSLPGTKYLVCGNHDPAWHGYQGANRRSRDPQRYKDAGFIEVNTGEPGKEWILSYEALGWDGVSQVILSHFPSHPEQPEMEYSHSERRSDGHEKHRLKDRFSYYRPQHRDNMPIICGHVHSSWKVNDRDTIMNINVGVDVWDYKPVSSDQILDLIKEERGAQWPNPLS